jgi:hypothetical protein
MHTRWPRGQVQIEFDIAAMMSSQRIASHRASSHAWREEERRRFEKRA